MQWAPDDYLKFEEERTRPSRDLLARVPLIDPQHIVDLGCGPGNSTELLLKQYPAASIVGVDNSYEMLEAARKRLPEVEFIHANIPEWNPQNLTDLIFANAVFQWVPNHLDVLERLLKSLHQGAVLAIQVPDNSDEPSHLLMRTVAEKDQWKGMFKKPTQRETIFSPAEYYNRLKPLSKRLDIWHTYYQHVLKGPEAIVAMIKPTGLGPFLQQLPTDKQGLFLADYEAEITKAYSRLIDGKVLFRFPRLFIVASRG